METIRQLIECYQQDRDSSFHKLRHHTRLNYTKVLHRIAARYGDVKIADIRSRQFLRWHEEWVGDGHIAMGHTMVAMLRTVFGFGATILEDAHCARLRGALSGMRFEMGKARVDRLTAAQADAIRAAAHSSGYASIALAQALQFDLMLRQKDVIGEWVPYTEPGTSAVLNRGEKWIRGLRWDEIDGNLILRHVTSKRQKPIEIDLRLAPMVMAELARIPPDNRFGPLVVCEATGRPWRAVTFRMYWRRVAEAAGLPKSVKNMDSRAGGITEATDAGAELEHVRHAATHSDIAMTMRYSRGDVEKVANVLRIRAEHRAKQ